MVDIWLIFNKFSVHCASYKIKPPEWDIYIANLQATNASTNKVLVLLYPDTCLNFYEGKTIINIVGKKNPSEMQRLPSTLKLRVSMKTYLKGVFLLLMIGGCVCVFFIWEENVGSSKLET